MKRLLLPVFILTFFIAKSQAPDSTEYLLRKVADRILADTKLSFTGVYDKKSYASYRDIVPDTVEVKFSSQYGNWQYTNGVLNLGMLHLGSALHEDKYTQFTLNHIKFGFDNYRFFQKTFRHDRKYNRWPFGEIWTMDELDDFGSMGSSVAEANAITPTAEWADYCERASSHLLTKRIRMDDGTWIRIMPVRNTLWADDLYMGISLLSRMGKYTGKAVYFDDAIKQVRNFYKHLWDEKSQLYFHCYYTDSKRNGLAHWGRANGWIALAQVHLLKALPANHPARKELTGYLEKQILGFAERQGANGLWHQLLDKSDSYEESSCSAMFTYAVAAAINNGWLDKRYAGIALRGWDGLVKNMITPDGQLKNTCIGTIVEDNLVYYYNRPTVVNDKHGTGIFLDAGIEIMALKNLLKTK